jgi:transcriptional regulator NrdR family protein
MRCPECGSPELDVKDSRPVKTQNAIRRRRTCRHCGFKFTTYEMIAVQERPSAFKLAHAVLDALGPGYIDD